MKVKRCKERMGNNKKTFIFNFHQRVFWGFRWKSGRVCKTGRFCTFAHGQEELRSWKEGHKKSNSENALPIRMQEPTSQRRERTADISGKEVLYFIAKKKQHIFMWCWLRNSSRERILF